MRYHIEIPHSFVSATETCPSDESLELYGATRPLTLDEEETLECHLLVCSVCQTRLGDISEQYQSIREALLVVRKGNGEPVPA